nr:hypothetical protein [Gammaproteobacteria bacterium]
MLPAPSAVRPRRTCCIVLRSAGRPPPLGEIVGVVGMRDGSHVYHLFVAEEHQGRGLGRVLREHAKAECLRRGRPAAFTVNSSRGAVPIYERFGFRIAAPEQEVEGVRFVPMRLELTSRENSRE